MDEIEYKDVMKRFAEFDERLERISAVLLKENKALLGALVQIEVIGRDTGSNSKACNMSNIARKILDEVGKKIP